MQSLFQDKETFVEFADSLKKKNKVLWNKFKQAIRKFLDKLDRELRVDNSTIRHGLDGTYRRLLTNARIGSVIGTVVKNAIPINGLKNNSPNVVGTYAMVSLCNDSQNREFIAVVVVEQQSGAIDSFELFDVAHAVSGRQKNSSQVDTKSQGVNPIKATTISIADLLNIVNSTHQSILSDNVLSHLGEFRAKNGSFADKILFSDRVANPTEKEVDGKVPRANRASLIKTSTSDRSISQSITTVNTINSTEKYSDRDYSCDNLVSKPDMKVTQIGTEAPSNRADIVFEAKRNASKIGKFNVKDGSVSVYVDDIGTDVILGTDGLKHGLRRSKNISMDINSLAILNAGEIIKHSVKINEIIPKDKNATSSYVLIGCAENSSSRFIVRSIINTFDNSLSKMDVLYAVKVKESAAQPAPGSAAKAVSSVTDSKISITDLLDYVNRCFPEVLSADVLKHFGHESRPEGNPKGLGESMLYSDRDGNAKDATQLTESDLRYLLEQIQEGELDTGYIPVARTTPQFYIDVVNEHSKGKTEVMKVPLASSVEHMMQNMEEYDGSTYEDDKTPHGLSTDDIITISKEMIHPKYIVLQRNGRYAEVVSFFSEKRKKQVVLSIDFAEDGESPKNFKHEQYMNGYNGGYYNIIVTEYEPTDLKSYLKNNEIVYDRQRMNGKYQVGSGRIVTVTHDTPFIQQDNTTVSDKSQEEALDKKQSKKKTISETTEKQYLELAKDPEKNNVKLREMVDEAARINGYEMSLKPALEEKRYIKEEYRVAMQKVAGEKLDVGAKEQTAWFDYRYKDGENPRVLKLGDQLFDYAYKQYKALDYIQS